MKKIQRCVIFFLYFIINIPLFKYPIFKTYRSIICKGYIIRPQPLTTKTRPTLKFNFHLFTHIMRRIMVYGQKEERMPSGACFPSAGGWSGFSPRNTRSVVDDPTTSSRYPGALNVTAPNESLPRLIHYSAWLTANDSRYIRFSKGSIARRLSLSLSLFLS